ncbi:MAG: hypothetical protein LBV15_05555, partial [Planctomycetota bacterium]|nr:hypothetical protein [Planctomycetota bacterium]
MTAKDSFGSLIERYNALSVPDQLILQAQSALMEEVPARTTASCLVKADCRESPHRAFSPQIVLTRLMRLAHKDLVRERRAASRGGEDRLWSCQPEVGEIALRHAVRDGHFFPLAKAVLD